MKYIDEYRDERVARALASEIAQRTTRPWVLMEICGGQTHTIMRYGLDELLPRGLELVHGPGCPVCVTPLETIDKAIELASRPDVILVSYGDMLRVPGSRSDLFRARALGGDVRIAYSPTEAVKIARVHPDRKVVFLAIGFETTAPANAMAAWQARREGLTNFSMLVSHVLVPPAIRALMASAENRACASMASSSAFRAILRAVNTAFCPSNWVRATWTSCRGSTCSSTRSRIHGGSVNHSG